MSPIYVRPEREQAEHDRLIRFLQAQYSEKFEALANPGEERIAPVKLAAVTHFPDLVLNEDSRLVGLVEIETVASVNNLETMAKWVPFSRARVPFHLYVPVQGYEAALRLAEAHQVKAAEIWTYRPATEGFDLVRMFVDPSLQVARPAKVSASKAAAAARTAAAAKAAPAAKAVPVAKPAQKATAGKPAAPVAKKAATVPKASARSAAKPAPRPVAKAKGKPAAPAKPSATRRPAAAPKRPAKPVRTSSAKPASKGGKKGAGARKGR